MTPTAFCLQVFWNKNGTKLKKDQNSEHFVTDMFWSHSLYKLGIDTGDDALVLRISVNRKTQGHQLLMYLVALDLGLSQMQDLD